MRAVWCSVAVVVCVQRRGRRAGARGRKPRRLLGCPMRQGEAEAGEAKGRRRRQGGGGQSRGRGEPSLAAPTRCAGPPSPAAWRCGRGGREGARGGLEGLGGVARARRTQKKLRERGGKGHRQPGALRHHRQKGKRQHRTGGEEGLCSCGEGGKGFCSTQERSNSAKRDKAGAGHWNAFHWRRRREERGEGTRGPVSERKGPLWQERPC